MSWSWTAGAGFRRAVSLPSFHKNHKRDGGHERLREFGQVNLCSSQQAPSLLTSTPQDELGEHRQFICVLPSLALVRTVPGWLAKVKPAVRELLGRGGVLDRIVDRRHHAK
jgi:hypothetical protein